MELLKFIILLGGNVNILSLVESITRGTDKKGQKFWTITLASGDTLFCWDWNKIADIKVNEEADFTIQAKGTFLHVLSALPVLRGEPDAESVPFDDLHPQDDFPASPEPPTIKQKPIEPPKSFQRPNKDKEIRTQALTKAACAAINGVPWEVFVEIAAGSNQDALAVRTAAIISMVTTFEEQF